MLLPLDLAALAWRHSHLTPELALGWRLGRHAHEWLDGLDRVRIAATGHAHTLTALRRLAPQLRRVEIEVTLGQREAHTGRRTLNIEDVGARPSPSSPRSPRPDSCGGPGDGRGDDAARPSPEPSPDLAPFFGPGDDGDDGDGSTPGNSGAEDDGDDPDRY